MERTENNREVKTEEWRYTGSEYSDLLSVESITGVARPSYRELVRRAIINARPPVGIMSKVRWACVRDVFAVGSTTATILCVAVGLDPDENLEGSVCEGCQYEDAFEGIE